MPAARHASQERCEMCSSALLLLLSPLTAVCSPEEVLVGPVSSPVCVNGEGLDCDGGPHAIVGEGSDVSRLSNLFLLATRPL